MLTKYEAFSFLEEHQPMPKDDELKESEIDKYEEVRKYFLDNPDEKCIPLFLNSFGGKDGLGVYQVVEDVILMYDSEIVLPHILKALDSTYEGVKYWAIQISSNFPSECLFNPLVSLLKLKDEDIKLATITAIAQLALNNIKKEEVIHILEKECKRISDEDIKEFAEEVLLDIQNSTL